MALKFITIIGARPQIIKASAISRAVNRFFSSELEEILVHTGQHYDENMSDLFFEELQIPKPKYNLNVGSDSHARQTAKMLVGLEEIFEKEKPKAVLVYGDTNSTLAGAMTAVKMHIPVIHVEAGLRSFNKNMPEEVNRIVCDHLSTLLFAPTKVGFENLKNEGIYSDETNKINQNNPKVFHCGDVMYDNSLHFSNVSDTRSSVLQRFDLKENQFVLCTLHRDFNTDNEFNLNPIFEAILEIQKKSNLKLILPMHPRTRSKIDLLLKQKIEQQIQENNHLIITEPLGYLDMIALEKHSKLIITDSGGVQKEAFFFKKPCIIMREETEWVEIVENGNAILSGANKEKIIDAFVALSNKEDFSYPNFYGDGNTAKFICHQILKYIN